MPQQIAAGIIIYRKTKEGIKFLFLYRGRDYWNFPKGKMEAQEKSWQTAFREIREETGLKSTDLKIEQNFKTYEKFTFRINKERIFKTVIFYLAETHEPHIVISPREHEGYAWFTYNEAQKALSNKYRDTIKALKKANDFLRAKSLRHNPTHFPR